MLLDFDLSRRFRCLSAWRDALVRTKDQVEKQKRKLELNVLESELIEAHNAANVRLCESTARLKEQVDIAEQRLSQILRLQPQRLNDEVWTLLLRAGRKRFSLKEHIWPVYPNSNPSPNPNPT